jgi:septum formation protein
MSHSERQAPDLILASGSPYRRMMLERLGLDFRVLAADIDESAHPQETAEVLAARLARQKAHTIARRHPQALVIGCDQVAECDGRLLGKPGSIEAAVEQLMHCRGKLVTFHSAIALAGQGRTEARLVPTRIHLRQLDEKAIRNYVERDRPLDCAGAMRSESLGIGLAKSISSDDPTALIGMPLIATLDLLACFGLSLFHDF